MYDIRPGPRQPFRLEKVPFPGRTNERTRAAVRLMQNVPSQQRQPLLCWDCNLPGHITRDCPVRNRPMYGPRPGNDTASQGLTRKIEDKPNVYVQMSLFGKEIPCLIDTGCELTLVLNDLIDQFPNVSLSPSFLKV